MYWNCFSSNPYAPLPKLNLNIRCIGIVHNYLIWVECPYIYPSRIKAVIHHILAKDTIDQIVMMALDNKNTGQKALIEAVKARIENLKNEG